MTQQTTKRTFDASASALAFPLGGIGTGNVSLGARGDLRDWEIFNRPAKGNLLPNTFFALYAKPEGEKAQVRVLEGPIAPPHTLSHGYHPITTAGLPRLAKSTFRGEYPFAHINFEDASLPLETTLEAYTPLIPLNPEDSGIPCAILTYTLRNTSNKLVALTLAASIMNPVGGLRRNVYDFIDANKKGKSVNEFRDAGSYHGLYLHAEGIDSNDLEYGSMSLVTDHKNLTTKRAWRRGAWFDFLREFWDDFAEDGLLTDLNYDELPKDGRPDTASLGIVDTLQPNESKTYQFILSWHFPNRMASWERESSKTIRNHYATRFDSAWSVADYVVKNLERLESETRKFHKALFDTTLPSYVLDALSANIVPLRSHTCFWTEDGRFYGWEGCFDDFGCCAGTCTHVWSYAYTLAYLFPSLERSMRETEFLIETEDDGYMTFRTFKTFGEKFEWPSEWGLQKPEPASDGQMGCILRVYREWQLCGDKKWLESLWDATKRAMFFASNHWDENNDGVLEGKQHNTYDIDFYGPNPLSSIYYLAALRAVEELAKVMNEPDTAKRCHTAFVKGSKTLDKMLWNGEYYIQRLEDVDQYPYQHGKGCLSDQLLGQLHARVLGLGDLLPARHVKKAVKAIFKHNFRKNFRDHVNAQRTYVLNDEAGLLLCSWPDGGQPKFPFVYSDEVWTGIEYQVAAHLIYEGWTKEGLKIVKAVQDRHDGVKRNPWNEVECGNHYSRSMASWAVLLALSGFHCDLGKNEMSFAPKLESSQDSFTTFWSTGKGWGIYSQEKNSQGQWQPKVEILAGDMTGVKVSACGKTWTL
jgi:non-lysosomal glucosylceramidase